MSIEGVHIGVSYNIVNVSTFKVYKLFDNLLWLDDIVSNDTNLFLEYDCTFIRKDDVQRLGYVSDIINLSSYCIPNLGQNINVLELMGDSPHEDILDEVDLCYTFLYYIF